MGIILVTGGAGFIGSHVAEAALDAGSEVVVIDDLSKGLRANVPPDVHIHEVDIADAAAMRGLVSAMPSLSGIVHCAAQSSVVASTSDPRRDLDVNVTGTLNVLAVAEAHSCPVTFASTGGALYGRTAPRPTAESHPPLPESPYGASKASAEVYLRLFETTTGTPVAILRLGNVYGPRQRGDGEAGVVAIFTERLREARPITLFGHGSPTRDYVHVQDVARAFVGALGCSGTFNIATGVETSVAQVYEYVLQGIGIEPTAAPTLADLRPGELEASCLDISLARADLGWEPSITATEGIVETARVLAAS